ncbi:RrF2 family transcriptional regulator [Bdellovibrio sp. HCB337]|uniref:RrF2 family transcriptional regulator n=1 Tax=Bdellovibrio sp. HCB337 TaxID=3394358 RepID=UPI0039A62389
MNDQRFSASVHIMTVLAFHKDEKMTSEQLAESIRTNPTVVRRLLAKLAEAGLLESFKGKAGGVLLAKPPKEITLKDIYMATTTDKKLICTSEKEPTKSCLVSCNMKEIMADVIEGFEDHSMVYLAKIRLSDLTSKVSKT